jgi:large subunit ribosomal protein L4
MPAPKAPVLGGKSAKDVSLDEAVFGVELKPHLVHEAVRAEANSHRQGTGVAKSRGLVSGGRAKPWRQKGTGRARQGTTRAPQWAGGGVVFGPHPRNYTGKVNRKARVKAIRIALSAHAGGGSLAAIDAGKWTETKTKAAAELLAGWRSERPLVMVVAPGEEALARPFRNIPGSLVVELGELEAADLVWARSLVVSTAALSILEGGESE